MWYSQSNPARTPHGWDVRPWEMPGNFRLDCEPHRGTLLRWMANLGLVFVLGALGLVMAVPVLYVVDESLSRFAFTLFLWFVGAGELIGLATWWLARRELAGMCAGRIDPSGEWEVQFARDRGLATALQGLLVLLICALVLAPW